MTDGKQRVRMAQYGTKHAHAPGVLAVMVANPEVEVVGVYEPDADRRRAAGVVGGRALVAGPVDRR